MKTTTAHKQTQPKGAVGKQYSYNEIVEYLDTHWLDELRDPSFQTIKKLDTAFGSPSKKLNSIIVGGTNGKSLTTHFAARLLKEDGLTVGSLNSPHILTYNERLSTQNEIITNKAFTDVANEVLHTATTISATLHSLDMLTMMAWRYFDLQKVDVAVMEISDTKGADPLMICNPKITAITRVTDYDQTEKGNALTEKNIMHTLSLVKKGSYVVSADQSKMNLHIMQNIVEKAGATWAMPIRKLAQLPYPFEQLHGRSAALAERIAQLYANNFLPQETVIVSHSLLVKQKGQRGRPTLEAKRQSELNPKRTLEQFWKDNTSTLAGRFQLLDKEKPTILLDTASNLDAFENLLLGIRLLHYQRPLKGLTLILGATHETLNSAELMKLLRYFFKKNSGSVIVCPVDPTPGISNADSWHAEKISNDIKSMKIKARYAKTFKEAFELAYKSVDERHGLVAIAGSSALVSEYWRYKGMKKL